MPLVLAMVYEVVSRYAFDRPTIWAFELSYMMMGVIFLLGISYALLKGQHVNVDFLHEALPRRGVAVIDFVGYVVLTGMSAWIAFALFRYFGEAYRSGEGSGLSAWNPPVWPYRFVFAIGFTLFSLQTLAKAIENGQLIFGERPGRARRMDPRS